MSCWQGSCLVGLWGSSAPPPQTSLDAKHLSPDKHCRKMLPHGPNDASFSCSPVYERDSLLDRHTSTLLLQFCHWG